MPGTRPTLQPSLSARVASPNFEELNYSAGGVSPEICGVDGPGARVETAFDASSSSRRIDL